MYYAKAILLISTLLYIISLPAQDTLDLYQKQQLELKSEDEANELDLNGELKLTEKATFQYEGNKPEGSFVNHKPKRKGKLLCWKRK